MATSGCDVVTELVWDENGAGTGSAVAGVSIKVGPPSVWTPDRLLSLAVLGCLMSSFMELAREAGLTVLGYVSRARAEPDLRDLPRLAVLSCAVVGSVADEELARDTFAEALRRSPLSRVFGARLEAGLEVQVVE